jgi:propionyl-CoA carboxylase alpha chain
VVAVSVAAGDVVADGAPVVSVEAMKMEHTLRAPFAGTVTDVRVGPGHRVELGAPLVVIEPDSEGSDGDLPDVRGGAPDNDVQDNDGQEAT